MHPHIISLELTFAGLHTLNPSVFHFPVAGTPAFLVPSTTRSTTAESTGFLKCAALWARHLISNRGGDGWHAD